MKTLAALLAITLAVPALAQTQGQTYSDLPGEILLDNDRVIVQKFVVPPGKSTGAHTRHGPALMVMIKGGTLVSEATQRATLWKDGSVFWADATAAADEGSINKGSKPIELIWVTLKPVTTPATRVTGDPYLNYPNIPGEDLLENDLVVVQRFVMYPGQWEGVHAHRPNMLYVFVKGSKWLSRSYKQARTDSGDSPDGSVGWMSTIDISEGHESGNIGKRASEVVWVTLKQ